EDGIRDFHVTGVQTCALPISSSLPACSAVASMDALFYFSFHEQRGSPASSSRIKRYSRRVEIGSDIKNRQVNSEQSRHKRDGRVDRKSTRLNSSHVKKLVCRL